MLCALGYALSVTRLIPKQIGHIRILGSLILGIELDLAWSGGSCGGIFSYVNVFPRKSLHFMPRSSSIPRIRIWPIWRIAHGIENSRNTSEILQKRSSILQQNLIPTWTFNSNQPETERGCKKNSTKSICLLRLNFLAKARNFVCYLNVLFQIISSIIQDIYTIPRYSTY